MRRSHLLLAIQVLAVLVVLMAVPGTSDAAGGTPFTLSPAPGQSSASSGYFVFPAAPGGQYTQVFVLRNTSAETIRVRLAAVDAATATHGGVSFALPEAPRKEMGAWIALEKAGYLLAPGKSVQTRSVVTVPGDARPGDHLAGVAAWVPKSAAAATEPPGGESTASIAVQTRLVVALQAVVPGPAEPELVVTGVASAVRPDGMYLEVAIASPGGALTSGSGTVELPDSGFTRDFAFGTFVPGTSINYPIMWNAAPSAGTYTAHVVVKYGDQGSKSAEWSGEFTVAAAGLADLKERMVAPEQSADVSTPWLIYGLIGGLVLVVFIMGFALLRMRRAGHKA